MDNPGLLGLLSGAVPLAFYAPAMTATPPDILPTPAAFPPPATNGDGILDFTPPAEDTQPKRFRIGPEPDDIFTAAASIPVLVSAQFARGMRELQETRDESQAIDGVLNLFRHVLWPEDVDRFIARCGDIRRPVDHRLLRRVMDGLMEQWGLRPQQPPEPSSGGEPDQEPGSSSPAEPPPEGSTSPASPSTASATSSTPTSPTPPTG